MMRNVQPIPTLLLTAILAGAASTGLATAAMAMGSGAGVSANAGAGAQAASPGYVQAGGAADAHMNAYVSTHSRWQSGATLIADRAGMNSTGQTPSATAEAAAKATIQAKHSGTR